MPRLPPSQRACRSKPARRVLHNEAKADRLRLLPSLPLIGSSDESPLRQKPRSGEAACANGNANGRKAEPVEQRENLIGAADQSQRWCDDADWEHFDSEPNPERQRCNQQQTKTVAKVKANPSPPHVRAPTR